MARNTSGLIAFAGISALANAAYATQPPCTTSDGDGNTACGSAALFSNTMGTLNTAVGFRALNSNMTGDNNTASGAYALVSNTTGAYNTGSGAYALHENTTGAYNTASGFRALNSNTTGTENTATGFVALGSNTEGAANTAFGIYALQANNLGNDNTALGYGTLGKNTSGGNNTATGLDALYANVAGNNNTATGYYALFNSTTGNYGTAFGYEALLNAQSGLGNIGVGPFAGKNIAKGQLNIDLGSWGTADESNTIRIGLPQYHLTTYIAGIANSHVTGAQVFVTANGQLGVLASSERYKTDIAPLGIGTDKLNELRPVSFHLKTDQNGALQYGLIAEEVDKVYPELVIRDNDGNIQGVRYDELAPMLLNEMQKEHATVATLFSQHEADAAKLDSQAKKITSLEQQLAGIQAALVKLQPKNDPVAQR